MAASKRLVSIKIIKKKKKYFFALAYMHVDIETNIPCIFLLPCLFPACLPAFLSSFRHNCLQIALLSCHSAGTSIILKLKENAAVFSYQKKLDLIRDLKTYFTCLWSLWIWLLLGCHCEIKTNMYVCEKDIHMVSFFYHQSWIKIIPTCFFLFVFSF